MFLKGRRNHEDEPSFNSLDSKKWISGFLGTQTVGLYDKNTHLRGSESSYREQNAYSLK